MKVRDLFPSVITEKQRGYLGGGVTPERRVSIMQQVGSRLGQPYAFGFVANREVNPRLRGWIRFRTFKNMATNSHIVHTGVSLYLDMLMKSKWKFIPALVEGEQGYEDAVMYADLAKQILMDDPRTEFRKIVGRSAMFRFNGYSVQNWYARRREDGVITIADISERPCETIEEISQDRFGYPVQFIQRKHDGNYDVIPIMNSVYLVDDSIHTEPEGTGLYRALYPYWEQVESYRNLLAVGYEKDMRGIMKGSADIESAILEAEEKFGEGATDAQVAEYVANKVKPLTDFVFAKRKASRTGVIVDSNVYEGANQLGDTRPIPARKQDVEAIEVEDASFSDLESTIRRIEREMTLIMGIQQVMLGSNNEGSWALSREQADEFGLRVSSSIDAVVDAFREQILKRIFMLNGWPMEMIPSVIAELPDYVSSKDKAVILTNMNALDVRDPAVDAVRAEVRLPPVPQELKDDAAKSAEMANTPDPAPEIAKRKKKPKNQPELL